MVSLAKFIVILFGIFFLGVGVLMLLKPEKARAYLRKAGSTNLINYIEITIRMIPAGGMILYSEFSNYPEILHLFGWFMIATSMVLYVVPRRIHHKYALWWADILTPTYFRLIAPFSMLFGYAILYAVL